MRIYTIEELEHDLAQLEIAWDMCDITEKYYLRQKQFLTDSIIDKQIGRTKRKLREMVEPYSDQVEPGEWNSFQIKLTACRSFTELKTLHRYWKTKLDAKLKTELPDLNLVA